MSPFESFLNNPGVNADARPARRLFFLASSSRINDMRSFLDDHLPLLWLKYIILMNVFVHLFVKPQFKDDQKTCFRGLLSKTTSRQLFPINANIIHVTLKPKTE